MAEKNIDQRLAEIEAEKVKLEAEKVKLRTEALPQYPKWIADPTDPEGKRGRTVATKEEEKAVLSSYEKEYAAADKQRKLDKKIADMKAEYDKEAEAEAEKVRLAAAKASAAAAREKK